jgi:hypothetical protein
MALSLLSSGIARSVARSVRRTSGISSGSTAVHFGLTQYHDLPADGSRQDWPCQKDLLQVAIGGCDAFCDAFPSNRGFLLKLRGMFVSSQAHISFRRLFADSRLPPA